MKWLLIGIGAIMVACWLLYLIGMGVILCFGVIAAGLEARTVKNLIQPCGIRKA